MDGVVIVATEVAVVRASCALGGGRRLVCFPLVLPAPPPPVVRSTCAHMLGVYDARDQYVVQQRVPSGEWADVVTAVNTGATPVQLRLRLVRCALVLVPPDTMLVILGYLHCHGLQHLLATCKAVSVHIPSAVRDEERLKHFGLVCGDLWSPLRQLRMFERVFEKEQPQAIAFMNAGRDLADNGFYGDASRMLRVGLLAFQRRGGVPYPRPVIALAQCMLHFNGHQPAVEFLEFWANPSQASPLWLRRVSVPVRWHLAGRLYCWGRELGLDEYVLRAAALFESFITEPFTTDPFAGGPPGTAAWSDQGEVCERVARCYLLSIDVRQFVVPGEEFSRVSALAVAWLRRACGHHAFPGRALLLMDTLLLAGPAGSSAYDECIELAVLATAASGAPGHLSGAEFLFTHVENVEYGHDLVRVLRRAADATRSAARSTRLYRQAASLEAALRQIV